MGGETPTQFNLEPDAGSRAASIGIIIQRIPNMNADEIGNIVRQLCTFFLSGSAAAAYVSGSQATAIAGGLAAIASVGWSIYAHWNMKKVPETAKA
jgi:hypothetical protein